MIKEKEITAMSDKMFKNIMKTKSGLNLMKGIIEEVLSEKVEEVEILNELKEKHDKIVDVRGHGLMIGVELSENGAGYVDKLREMGFLINCTAGNVLRFVPPLIITNEEIDKFVEALDKAL